jgi:putative hydrolase of the HAD superfamily
MDARANRLPLAEIDTLFLDAGGTLISMDFGRIASELGALGHVCEPSALARAEAAARPRVSRAIASGGSTEGRDTFSVYVDLVLRRVLSLADDARSALVSRLVPRIRFPGRSLELWSAVLPGVPEALARLREAGFRLVVVSNADGTVEEGLTRAGLRPHLHAVVDSHVVGFEKPDSRIFAHALSLFDSDPARTLHVGDMYAADVVGARSAGVHALLLDPHGDWGDVDCPVTRDVPTLARTLLEIREARG